MSARGGHNRIMTWGMWAYARWMWTYDAPGEVICCYFGIERRTLYTYADRHDWPNRSRYDERPIRHRTDRRAQPRVDAPLRRCWDHEQINCAQCGSTKAA